MTAAAWPADSAPERRPLKSLVPYARNTRIHSREQVKQIAASMKAFGVVWPALVDEAGEIIAGHGRILAAEFNGWPDYPVIVARGWTPEQIKAYRIADNQLALNASWDAALLGLELADLTEEMRLITGLAEAEIERLMIGDGKAGLTDPDDAPELPAEPVTELGDLWLCGKHRLLCGDATAKADVERLLDGARPGLMVTDPPYGVSYDPTWRDETGGRFGDGKTKARGKVANDDQADWSAAWTLFPGAVAYVWHASLRTGEVSAGLIANGFGLRAQIIWHKSHFTLMRTGYHWQHEPCWYAVRKGQTGRWHGDRTQSTVWDIQGMNPAGRNRDAGNEKTGHGTQKPVECMRRPMLNSSAIGEAVYDPFVGSGTTLIAAEMTSRAALALDIDPAYVDVAVKRWEAFTGDAAHLAGTTSTFDQIARQRARVAA